MQTGKGIDLSRYVMDYHANTCREWAGVIETKPYCGSRHCGDCIFNELFGSVSPQQVNLLRTIMAIKVN